MLSFNFVILSGIVAYLAGSIIWGHLMARWGGVDIRKVGTRNPGAANVFRTIGIIPGVIAFVADVLTATLVVIIAGFLPAPEMIRLAASVMLLVGTSYPVFFGFRGGTGLAKGMGAVLAISPVGFLVGVPVGLLVLWKLHNTGWAGGLTIVVALVLSALVYGDLAGAGTIAIVGLVVAARSKLQYRNLVQVKGPSLDVFR